MKRLPSTHPWSFTQQANIHCAYCSGTYAQPSSPELPIHVHASWLFLPFHRAYLYFYERILGKLIGDDSFALPFWNWDSPEGMTIPPIFSDPNSPLYNPLRNKLHRPPSVADLDFNGTEAMLNFVEQVAHNFKVMYRDIVSGAKSVELFYGSPYRAGDQPFSGTGSLERGAHNALHMWIGGDLPSVSLAGLDPLFFAHHANGDRLWEVWKGLQVNESEAFADSDWLDASFVFWDENLRLVRIKVRDCLGIGKLKYKYENVAIQWLDSRPEVERFERSSMALSATKFPVELNSTMVSVVVSRKGPDGMREGEEALVIDDIEFDRRDNARFDVYVGSNSGRINVGRFSKLPAGERPATVRTQARFGVKDALMEIGALEDESVVVSLVPCLERGSTVKVGNVTILFV